MSSRPAERLLIIVPAWNEQITLPGVIAEIGAALPHAEVLVVNDGSSDQTAAAAAKSGAMVLDLPVNLGVGGAMRAGYKFALRNGFDRTVQLDADGQHDPRDVPKLLDALDAAGVNIVIGARFAGTGTYRARGPRLWSMKLLSTILSRVTKTRLTDTTSGFKACDRSAIQLFASNYPAEYLGDTVEALVIAARAGLTVRQVGVEMRPRAGGTASHSPLKAGIFLLRAFLALVIALSRPSEPLEPETAA